jgi:inhibitor of cysteine peptidase
LFTNHVGLLYPVDAISPEDELPAAYRADIEANRRFFAEGPGYWSFDLEQSSAAPPCLMPANGRSAMPRHVVVALAGALILAACGAGSMQLHEQDAGRTIPMRQSDRLEVALLGNPTTGYTWEQAGGDDAVLRSAGEPAFQPASSAVGSGGVITFVFVASNPGQTTLTLVYHRAFEPNVPPLKTFQVGVIVR